MNTTSFLRRGFRTIAIGACVGITASCSGGDIIQLPSNADADRIWSVRLDTKALALAVGDTYQLSVTPLNGDREPLTGLPPVRFRSLNAARVSVDNTGLIKGLSSTSGASVIAELTVDGATYADTVAVYVTETAHVVRSIALVDWMNTPIPTVLGYDASVSYSTKLFDTFGVEIPGIVPWVISSDPSIVRASAFFAMGANVGKAIIRSSIVAYGQHVTDSVEMRVVIPSSATFTLWSPPFGTQLVATGGSITWINSTFENKSYNITFESNSPSIVGGNIDLLTPYASATRTFTAPGAYAYRDTINKTSGVVLVRDQPAY